MRDGAVDLLCVEPAELGGGNRGAENAEHRARVETARHQCRDELGRHPFHNFIAGGDRDKKFAARGAGNFRCDQGRRQDRGAGMGQHAERVPLAAGKDRLGVDKGRTRLGQLGAIAQHGRGPAAARLLLAHHRQRLLARGHVVRHEGGGERL